MMLGEDINAEPTWHRFGVETVSTVKSEKHGGNEASLPKKVNVASGRLIGINTVYSRHGRLILLEDSLNNRFVDRTKTEKIDLTDRLPLPMPSRIPSTLH